MCLFVCVDLRFAYFSDDNTLAMVDLMLDNLCGPAGEGFQSRLELFVLVLHLDGLPAARFARAGQRQTALLGLIAAGLLDDLRVEHHHIRSLVIERDDALVHADHVRRHADTAVLVRFERFQQVGCGLDIVRRGLLGLLR